MARRVSWTNNSSGHDGTYVYRAETLDPANLPEPVATVDPVAQGVTAEWVDDSDVYECYAVQDFDAQGGGGLSSQVCVEDPWAGVAVGDEVGGGVYAGTIIYADGREFHIIYGKAVSEVANYEWGPIGVTTGADDVDDGKANQEIILTNYGTENYEVFIYCRDYVDANGNNDYYPPSQNELILADQLFAMDHPEFADTLSKYRWSSTEVGSNGAYGRRGDGAASSFTKTNTTPNLRPVRRVPA